MPIYVEAVQIFNVTKSDTFYPTVFQCHYRMSLVVFWKCQRTSVSGQNFLFIGRKNVDQLTKMYVYISEGGQGVGWRCKQYTPQITHNFITKKNVDRELPPPQIFRNPFFVFSLKKTSDFEKYFTLYLRYVKKKQVLTPVMRF